jgi:hypothetical protein
LTQTRDGGLAFRAIGLIKPNVKVILSSGYSEREVKSHYGDLDLAGFLYNPHDMETLKDKLAPVLVPDAPSIH